MSTQRVMVYVNEGDKKGRKVIESNAGRVLASYGHGLLVEADQAQLKALQKQGYSVEVQKEASMIKLRAVQFDTSVAVPATPAALTLTAAKRPTKQKRDYWLIQMVGPVKSEWGEQLMALGVKLGDYVPENAFLAHMTADAAENARALPFVNWVGLYEPAYKISPLLMGRKQRAMGNELATLAIKADIFKPAPEGNLTVLVHTPADRQKVVKAIEKAGGSIVASEGDTITASLDLAVADTIAKMMEVKWLEPHGRPVLHNNISAGIIGVQDVWDNHALDGDEQIVSVADTGLDTGVNDTTMHDDFEGRIINIYDRVGDGADDGGSNDDSGHGTHVAGSVLGNGSRSNGSVCGMAPAARLVFQAVKRASNDHLDGIPADYNTLFQQAYDDGARIHTNSWGATHDAWGNSLQGQYTTESQDIDEFMWNHKDSIILFSAANAGRDSNSNGVIDTDSLAVQACAKNCVTVGATEGNRPHGSTPAPGYDFDWATGSWAAYFPAAPINNDHVSDDPEGMAAFSSRGPTDDGRPKPDVVAPGTNILSVRSSAVTATPLWGDLPAADALHDLYCWSGGTSMSTPLTAGTVALIRQYLQRVCLHASPSGSLLKAVLIHGAVPITGQYTPAEVGAVPDNSQGWGRVNLQTSLFPDYPVRWEFRDNAADAVATGEQRNYTFPVVNTTVPFRATLAWTDFPSDPATGGGLVNQLRLSVIAPNGITTQGNPANNNVQQVVINNPQAGTYTVRVTGVNVPTLASEGQRQDFAVVISGGLNFVEVYIKDNPADTGIAPSAGTLCQSPDILVCLDNDPTATPAPNPEFGQTNYVFVRIHNRGPKAANNATVKLYWANPGTNLSKPFWHTDGIKLGGVAGNTQQVTVPARAAAGDSEVITSAFEWLPPDPSINTH
ncbi:MAG: S8 family serine peptidase, partial [Dehalococcoidales bacterium]